MYEKCDGSTSKILGIVTVNLRYQEKHFVDLGLTGNVRVANHSFVSLVSETYHFKKLAD